MTCGEGALQTRGTCWFFSIINGFLLSDAGQKILFDHLEKFYKNLSLLEKAQFDDGVPAPCVKSLITAKRIYFYKFLDQYLCFRSGARSASLKAGKSANILGGASLAGTIAKAHSGGKGGHPQEELPKILKHLGITDYIIANKYAYIPIADARKRPHFLVAVSSKSERMDSIPSFRPKTYSKMCCSITIGNSSASNSQQHKWHAITGYTCNGKGYLFDSNQRKQFPCDWWKWNDLKRVVDNEVARYYDFFMGGQINYMGYNFVIFSRNDYIDSIKPVCHLKYKKTKTPTGIYTRVNNFSARLERGNWPNLKPAQIAAIKRARARRGTGPVLNKNFYDGLLASTKSRADAMQTIKNMENSGYRINVNTQHKFLLNLSKKFKSPTSPEYSPVNDAFTEAKRAMSSTRPTKAARAIYYSLYWKKVLPHERKVLAHFRDHGVWHARNYFKKSSPSVKPPIKRKPKSPSPNSPKTARRKEIETGFKNYWGTLTQNNRKTVRNLISTLKSPTPVKPKSPNSSKFLNAFKNINTLKTAKARAEWLKAKKGNFSKNEIASLKSHVKVWNQMNRNRRAVKKPLKK
jgi:hypothetical protein